MKNSIINHQAFADQMAVELQARLIEAAEPVVQKALADIEKALRQRVAQFALGMIESDYSVERMGNIIQIRINQTPGIRP